MTTAKKYLKLENILWIILLVISLISLFSNIGTYIKGGDVKRDPKWIELIIIPFYFTQQSNFLAFILSFLICFKLIKNRNLIKTLSIFMVVNLIVTFIVYWIILFPKKTENDSWSWFRDITLHGLTPILGVVVFIVKYIVNKTNDEKKENIWKKSALHLIYPIVYLMIAILIYFILGGDEEDAIYSFLKIRTKPIISTIYIPSVAIFYYLLTILFIFLTNPKKTKR